MNLPTILAAAIVAVIFIAIVAKGIKNAKEGKGSCSGCSGSCQGCSCSCDRTESSHCH